MVRTQVYLSEEERKGLNLLARASGKKQSLLIREAVDLLIEQSGAARRARVLGAAGGLWRDRDDLPDLAALRGEWDRT